MLFVRDCHPNVEAILSELRPGLFSDAGYELHVIDKTEDAKLRRLVAGLPHTTIHRRPRDELYFATLSGVDLSHCARVIQVHEDDTIHGYPRPVQDTRCGVIPTRTRKSPEPRALRRGFSHQELFFGAIREDLLGSFGHFSDEQTHPSPALDQTLVMWLHQLPIGPDESGFTYEYNNTNWSAYLDVSRNNSQILTAVGWPEGTPITVMSWMIYFDGICSLHYLRDYVSPSRLRNLARRLLTDAPPFAGSPSAMMLRALPSAVRAAVVSTRGLGRGHRRIGSIMRDAVALQQQRGLNGQDLILEAGFRRPDLWNLVDVVLPRLQELGGHSIEARCNTWLSQLGRVEDLLT